ncbi:MAG: DUF4392 domain-containing protein [Deltaproteobacteria bacterium]|nr:MAG: DUF4392 domain-containing protein [Deltaproteobacteria bacterium]
MRVEEVILRNAHVRGIDKLIPFLPVDFCLEAAKAVFRLLEEKENPKILITTGFYVGGAPETDGPPGAYFLYKALKRLGFLPKIITDTICAPLFEGAILNEDLITVPEEVEDEGLFRNQIFEIFLPDVLMAVERCGRTGEGAYQDMRGNDISAFTAPIDALFIEPPPGSITIGIGDGGNEIGMGKLMDEISRHLEVSPCIVQTDYLILATVSNWGACGLSRCLEMLSGRSCLPNSEEVEDFIAHIVSRGAVDGISRLREHRVDGYDLAWIREILEALSGCTLETL